MHDSSNIYIYIKTTRKKTFSASKTILKDREIVTLFNRNTMENITITLSMKFLILLRRGRLCNIRLLDYDSTRYAQRVFSSRSKLRRILNPRNSTEFLIYHSLGNFEKCC